MEPVVTMEVIRRMKNKVRVEEGNQKTVRRAAAKVEVG